MGIGYERKSRLNEEGVWASEVVRRLGLEENRDKYVSVEFERNNQQIHITLKDQGSGFDWEPYLRIDPERSMDNHGRGIAMARMISFDHIEYRSCGNEVVASLNILK